MMEHLNFCRQMVKQFTAEAAIPSVSQEVKQFKSHCIDLARASQKFILPDGGRLYDDPDYKALDETVPLSLPYPLIAIEFSRSPDYVDAHKHRVAGNTQPTKALLFAREREDAIAITVVVWAGFAGVWAPYPEVAIPRTNYLDRAQRLNGYTAVKLAQNPAANFYGRPIPGSDYMDEVGALLCMLNILQCKNVHVEKSEVSKTRKAMQAGKKGALPFDTYHLLTIDVPGKAGAGAATGGHRSPREHLRRGHIRNLADGRRIWVNATVVAAGRGGGVVSKDYTLRCSA
jgi:hypothetical protein